MKNYDAERYIQVFNDGEILFNIHTYIPLTGLTLPYFCACPKPGPGILMSYVVIFNVQWVEM